MPKDKEEVLDLIKKLLALSHSPNEHEAALAASKAQGLLFKHKLSMAEVEIHTKGQEKPQVGDISLDVEGPRKDGKWRPTLINAVARYNFCRAILITDHKVAIIGQQEDVEVVRELYNWLVIQIDDLARRACYSYRGHSRIPTFKRAFYTGCVVVVRGKLYENWRGFSRQSDSAYALVVRSQTLVTSYITHKFGPLRSVRRRMANGSWDGFKEGKAAGEKIDIHIKKKISEGERLMLE